MDGREVVSYKCLHPNDSYILRYHQVAGKIIAIPECIVRDYLDVFADIQGGKSLAILHPTVFWKAAISGIVIQGGEIITRLKGAIANGSHVLMDGERTSVGCSVKGIITYGGYCAGNGEFAGNRRAITESIVSNGGHRVGDGDCRKSTRGKSPVRNGGQICVNGQRTALETAGESPFADFSDRSRYGKAFVVERNLLKSVCTDSLHVPQG